MRSVCPWTSSFRKKMDSSDDRELIFGAGMCGAGRGDEVSLSLDEFISENGLVR